MKKSVIILIIIFSCFSIKTKAQTSNDSQSGKLTIAACQFPISDNISENYNWIKSQIVEANLKKADIVHFAECALTGYPEVDMKSLDNFDWDLLYEKTDSILMLANQLNIWVVLGSIHRLSEGVKPHNCMYIINPDGEIVDRYDKRFLTGGDLKHFSPGDHFVNFLGSTPFSPQP